MAEHYNDFPAIGDSSGEISSAGYDDSLTIAVEGNIGAGKSTFLEFCHSKPGCLGLPEPVDKWTNLNGTNLLAEFYADRSRWAFPFQLYVGMTLLDNYVKPTWNTLKFVGSVNM